MSLDVDTIKTLLDVLAQKFDDNFILTGSLADHLHIGFADINDIDIFMEEKIFSHYKHKLAEQPTLFFMKAFVGVRTNIGTSLHKYAYNNHIIDISIINPETYGWRYGTIRKETLDDTEIVDKQLFGKTYKVFAPIVRFHQLASHNYKRSHPNYLEKVAKANMRAEQYKKMLGLNET